MFTGIVEELGGVVAIDHLVDAARLTVRGPLVTSDSAHGDSIAVNGVCLTVVDVVGEGDSRAFTADVMAETLARSSLGILRPGSPVNLERAAALSSRLGGHMVQGHVDGVGTVIDRSPSEHWEIVRVAVPRDLLRYVVEKGSITIDGVSLTVVAVGDEAPGSVVRDTRSRSLGWLSVSLIPTTLQLTTLGAAAEGQPVTLEVDVIAKYVEKLIAWRNE